MVDLVKSAKDWLRVEYRLFPLPCGVISFPKSGKTWLYVMLTELGIEVDSHHAGAEIVGPLVSRIDRRAHRRYRRGLVLVRDPRDTVVSYFHACTRRQGKHARLRHLYPRQLGDFLRDPRFGIEKIALFNLLWGDTASRTPYLRMLTYERLSAATSESLANVAAFFGHPVSEDAVARAVEDTRFEKMQAREASGEYGRRFGRKLTPGNPDDLNSFKVRKGQVGGYQDEMSAEDIAFCDAQLDRLDYFENLQQALQAASVGGFADPGVDCTVQRPAIAG